MSDTSSVRSSSRASTFMNRPQIAPMGPRTRQTSMRASTLLENNTASQVNALDLTEFGGRRSMNSSPSPISPRSSQSMHSSVRKSLQPVSEEPLPPFQVPVYDPETSTQTSSPLSDTDALSTSQAHAPMSAFGEPTSPSSVAPWHTPEASASEPVDPMSTSVAEPYQTPQEPPSPESAPAYDHDSRFPSDVDPELEPQSPVLYPSEPAIPDTAVQALPEPAAQVKVTATAVAPPPKLTPPSPIKFESTPISWKGLPLDAALWTIDSGELQDIVSRAIRASASESFIRLLTAENLDTVLPAELARLESLKVVTQSKYRFLVHRRTMLFHALNSTTLGQQKDGEDGVSVVSRLSSQLADTIGECDRNLEEVIKINDQVAQINKLIDLHWSGALAIALRKLNGSYARRTADLVTAKERITQLEGELAEAWKEAERMAQELDDYEAAIVADDTEVIIGTAEVVTVPKPTSSHNRRTSVPMSPTLLAFTPAASTTPKSPVSPGSPGMSNFVFPPVVHLKAKETEAEDVPDTVSIRSTRSGKSHRSGWTAESGNYVSAVHSAKKRSHRASQSSLRLSISHIKKQSDSRSRTPYDDHPPVPELPVRFTPFNGIMSAVSANASSMLLNFDTNLNPHLRRQVSLDSVRTGGGRPVPAAYRGRAAAMDDLYIRPQGRDQSKESEIQLVQRNVSSSSSQNFASMYEYHSLGSTNARPTHKAKDPSKTIPSMWMNVDAIKPNARSKSPESRPQQQVQLPPRSPSAPSTSSHPSSGEPPSATSNATQSQSSKTSARNSTYEKIRGLTKRYSVSLPMFSSQPRSTSRRSG